MSSSPARPPFLGALVAVGAAILGLVALGAASLGLAGLRVPGLSLLVVGGVVAATVRWKEERRGRDREAVIDLETARERLERGDLVAAMTSASKAVTSAMTPHTRNAALTILAWAALGRGYPERAKAALDRVEPSHALDLGCLAAVESARGEPERAIDALEIARTAGTLSLDGAKLLVDCYLRLYGIDRAVMAALQVREALGAENCKIVVKAAYDAGAQVAAAALASAIRSDTPVRPIVESAHAR